MNGIPERIENIRKYYSYSKKDISRILNIPYSSYRRYVDNISDIPASVLIKFKRLDVNFNYLLMGKGPIIKGHNIRQDSNSVNDQINSETGKMRSFSDSLKYEDDGKLQILEQRLLELSMKLDKLDPNQTDKLIQSMADIVDVFL